MNFVGDWFTFAINQVDSHDKTTEKLTSANNICVVQAAFDEYLHHLTRTPSFSLRHRSRIIRKKNGIGKPREWIIAKGRN
jgi:hypothetical protein